MRQNKFFMKKKNATDKQFANIEEGLSKAEQFVEDNRKILFIIIGSIIFLFVGYYGYQNLYKSPLNEKAQKQLFIGEKYFEKDSFGLALNGSNNFEGLLTIAKKYSNTKSGQLANYYAGISYLRIGDYKNAIKTLEKYNSNDQLLLSISKMAIGDAFSEINQPNEAIEYYQQSIKISQNELITPIALMKCARLYELEKKYNNALDCYKTIKNEYPESTTGKTIDKYINNINNK